MNAHRPILVEIAPGELIDKLTILEIKSRRMTDPARLANVKRELESLAEQARRLPGLPALDELTRRLREVNQSLWDVEDELRDCERRRDFGPRFIELARSVYHTNDTRADLKRQINLLLGSEIIEEKSYAPYG